jgi:hypothetical protein
MSNVYTTEYWATDNGACSLPVANYDPTIHPVALGDIASLQSLKFKSNLCGHTLKLNCGKGDIDLIVTDSNQGHGLDLYESTWIKATANGPSGIIYCSVQLTTKNIFNSTSSPVCYYYDGIINNDYYRNVGLLNTGGKIVVSAKLDSGVSGQLDQFSPYFAFSYAKSNQMVTFNFDDGSSYKLPFSSCLSGANKQVWR